MTAENKPSRARIARAPRGAFLQEGWVTANHILGAFHVAFISSVLALSAEALFRAEVLGFIFVSSETLVLDAADWARSVECTGFPGGLPRPGYRLY